jgi:hypothetical protein
MIKILTFILPAAWIKKSREKEDRKYFIEERVRNIETEIDKIIERLAKEKKQEAGK